TPCARDAATLGAMIAHRPCAFLFGLSPIVWVTCGRSCASHVVGALPTAQNSDVMLPPPLGCAPRRVRQGGYYVHHGAADRCACGHRGGEQPVLRRGSAAGCRRLRERLHRGGSLAAAQRRYGAWPASAPTDVARGA